jgi:cystathionine beta-lyase/cystathionine gamma-synthase
MSDQYRAEIAGHELSPESLMMGYGYKPERSEGALKSPIFETSTFTFTSAADDGCDVYTAQCDGPGAMISIWIDGGETEAFRFLDSLQLAHLAVSLGSTETLVQHPASMTHAGVDPEDEIRFDVTDALIRISIGVENPDDIIADLANALDKT